MKNVFRNFRSQECRPLFVQFFSVLQDDLSMSMLQISFWCIHRCKNLLIGIFVVRLFGIDKHSLHTPNRNVLCGFGFDLVYLELWLLEAKLWAGLCWSVCIIFSAPKVIQTPCFISSFLVSWSTTSEKRWRFCKKKSILW